MAGLALLLASAALQVAPLGAVAATEDVAVQDDMFAPASITIDAGDTVEWTWSGPNPHSVTSDAGGLFNSGVLNSGAFAFTFTSAGTYAYYCSVHGARGGIGMSGTVTVQGAPTSTAVPASPTPDDDETPEATSTAQSSPTPLATVSGNPAPILEAMPIAAPATAAAGGGAGPASQLPSSGTGVDARGGAIGWLSAALALMGIGLLSGAVYVKRRA